MGRLPYANQIMSRATHPNIAKLHAVIDDQLQTEMVMVMELLEGGSLMPGYVQ